MSSTTPSSTTFADLGVASTVLPALKRSGIATPFPIQEATLPDAIAGRDLLARGQTGSGKTLAFGLALITRLAGRKAYPRKPRGLILVPTRELAMQVSDTLSPLADPAGLRVRLIAGGMPYAKQIQGLDRGAQILVATPGRLMDLVNRGVADLSDCEITVLDEADQMADLGFLPIVREILELTKPRGQKLLFSATLDGDVDALIKDFMRDPVRHSLAPVNAQVSTMEHFVLVVHPKDKDEIAAQIASREGRTILFARTQAGVDRLADYLASRGVPAGSLHGGKTQALRTRTLNAFREGVTTALVATDVAARGIHVDGISLVVHVDAPTDSKDYQHRSGRTARAGEEGTVVTLSSPRQLKFVESMTKKAGANPVVVRVRPGDSELIAITGAVEPSGIPWEPPKDRSASRAKPRHWKQASDARPPHGERNRPSKFGKRAGHTKSHPYANDFPKADWSKSGVGKSDRPRTERSTSDSYRSDRTKSDRTKSDYGKSDYSRSDRPKSDYAKSDRPRSDRPKSDYGKSGYAKSDRSGSDRSGSDRQKSGYPKTGDKPGRKPAGKPYAKHTVKSGASAASKPGKPGKPGRPAGRTDKPIGKARHKKSRP